MFVLNRIRIYIIILLDRQPAAEICTSIGYASMSRFFYCITFCNTIKKKNDVQLCISIFRLQLINSNPTILSNIVSTSAVLIRL